MSNELAKQKTDQMMTQPNDSASLMAVISSSAKDPSVDVVKLEKLMDLYERINLKNAEMAFNNAMNQAQAEMAPVRTDCNNPQTSSKYASYAALDRAIRPIYSKHGFSLSFNTGDAPENTVNVLCDVSHKDGYTKNYKILMPADGKGPKGGDVMTKTHAAGSGISYGMRYLLKMIFNISTAESDDDGNAASTKYINKEQINEIHALISDNDLSMEAFTKWLHSSTIKIESIEKIPDKAFGMIVTVVKAMIKEKNK